MAPASRTLRLETGIGCHFLEWGEGDHSVFLLHGFLDNAWGWEPVVDAGLGRAGLHLVAPDFRGHGDSDRVGAGGYYYFADYLADLDALIKAVARNRVSLCGHSMGANVSTYFTGTFPSRIHKLALLEAVSPPLRGDVGPDRMLAWIEGWRRARERPQHTYATVEEAAERLIERDPRTPRAIALRLAANGTVREADNRFRFKHDRIHLTPGPYTISTEQARSFWERIRCPTLLIEAAQSEYRREDGRVSWVEIAGARRATVEDAGHMLLRHQPAAVAGLLRAFLEG